jgi:hypothetical protein
LFEKMQELLCDVWSLGLEVQIGDEKRCHTIRRYTVTSF